MSRRGRHPHNRLTVAVVNRARPGRHADGNGLYLVVRPSLARSWIQRVTINKQRTDLGLGPYPLVSLAAARRAAIENLLTLRDGRDPRDKAAPTEVRRVRPSVRSTRSSPKIAVRIGRERRAKPRGAVALISTFFRSSAKSRLGPFRSAMSGTLFARTGTVATRPGLSCGRISRPSSIGPSRRTTGSTILLPP